MNDDMRAAIRERMDQLFGTSPDDLRATTETQLQAATEALEIAKASEAAATEIAELEEEVATLRGMLLGAYTLNTPPPGGVAFTSPPHHSLFTHVLRRPYDRSKNPQVAIKVPLSRSRGQAVSRCITLNGERYRLLFAESAQDAHLARLKGWREDVTDLFLAEVADRLGVLDRLAAEVDHNDDDNDDNDDDSATIALSDAPESIEATETHPEPSEPPSAPSGEETGTVAPESANTDSTEFTLENVKACKDYRQLQAWSRALDLPAGRSGAELRKALIRVLTTTTRPRAARS